MKLPSYQELSKEQVTAFNLPLEGSYLVSGPPGTGKTVIALHRAATLRDSVPVKLITYSNLLKQYTDAAVEELKLNGTVCTYHSWVWKFYNKHYKQDPPQIEDYVYDWTAILKQINSSPPDPEKLPYLLIDEGQDLPCSFYMFARYATDQLVVFADENQQIDDTNCTLDAIRSNALLKDECRLSRNYRNTKQIAALAREFYTGLGTGIPELPERSGPKPVMMKINDLKEAVNFIIRYEKNNDDQEIGVFTSSLDLQNKILRLLTGNTVNPVQHYSFRNRAPLDFDKPGIKMVQYKSAKGLEFDAVFMPEIQKLGDARHFPDISMMLYVLISRARKHLYFFNSGEGVPPVMDKLSKDLMEWK